MFLHTSNDTWQADVLLHQNRIHKTSYFLISTDEQHILNNIFVPMSLKFRLSNAFRLAAGLNTNKNTQTKEQ